MKLDKVALEKTLHGIAERLGSDVSQEEMDSIFRGAKHAIQLYVDALPINSERDALRRLSAARNSFRTIIDNSIALQGVLELHKNPLNSELIHHMTLFAKVIAVQADAHLGTIQ